MNRDRETAKAPSAQTSRLTYSDEEMANQQTLELSWNSPLVRSDSRWEFEGTLAHQTI